jgi:hypothetical protein
MAGSSEFSSNVRGRIVANELAANMPISAEKWLFSPKTLLVRGKAVDTAPCADRL